MHLEKESDKRLLIKASQISKNEIDLAIDFAGEIFRANEVFWNLKKFYAIEDDLGTNTVREILMHKITRRLRELALEGKIRVIKNSKSARYYEKVKK